MYSMKMKSLKIVSVDTMIYGQTTKKIFQKIRFGLSGDFLKKVFPCNILTCLCTYIPFILIIFDKIEQNTYRLQA